MSQFVIEIERQSSDESPTHNPLADAPARLQLKGITKRYPAVTANDKVSLNVRPGEVHAILGENGAGKSTLMKIIYGAVKPDEGAILVDGKPVQVRNPKRRGRWALPWCFSISACLTH